MNLVEITKKIFSKDFRFIFFCIFLIELISLSGYLVPQINSIFFFIIILLTLYFSLKNLKYGVYIILIELFIGSKGYLFYFETGGLMLSIRIALYLLVMAVWLSKVIVSTTQKEKSIFISKDIWKRDNLPLFLILFIFIIWGIINGILNGNEFNNLLFDFNAWLYFLLLLPIYETAKKEDAFVKNFLQIFFASTIWLCLKTFILLFIFSHNLIGAVFEVYRWIRTTGIGEITSMDTGFVRIFFQSHLFVLIGFFITLFIFNEFILKEKGYLKNKLFWLYLGVLSIFLSIILISFSRSFWVGGSASFLIYIIIMIKKYSYKNLFRTFLILITSCVISVSLIALVVKFPYPKPNADFNLFQITDRAKNLRDENAVSSRYALMIPLWKTIKEAPILGKGFGTTVTYKTSDPRILEQTTDGSYTTYAFEWGWLDIWLKLGILGSIFYLFLLGKISIQGFFSKNWLILSLSLGLLLIAIVSIFSPYTNHPLGIGYLIITTSILSKKEQ